jgi:hypothetical protein
VWQEVRQELSGSGLEVVTVALESRDAALAARWIERARPEHPSLIDAGHLLDELYGVVNVPSGVWIDEGGTMVRPVETAFAERTVREPLAGEPSPYLREVLQEARKLRVDRPAYFAAIRDWAARGAESRFALTPEEVLARSRQRSPEVALAAARFELGQHLHRSGDPAAAVPHFREAHRLQPDNWTYKRQAWVIANPEQGPTSEYEGYWLADVRRTGPENYYPPLDL